LRSPRIRQARETVDAPERLLGHQLRRVKNV